MAIQKREDANNKKKPAEKKPATSAASARRRSVNKPNNRLAVAKNKALAKTAKKSTRTGSRSVANSPSPHPTVSGKFQKILDDISNHKITDKQEAYLATFPELNREPILELDKDGVICYLNPSGKSLFPELLALGTRHPLLSDYTEVQKELRRDRKKHAVTNEKQIGSDYYERTFFLVGENHVRIYARDITKRKITEQTLQTAEQALHNEVENSPLGIAIVRVGGEKIYANPALLNIFGFIDTQEFLDTPVRSFYSPQSWEESEVRRLRRQSGEPVPDGYEITIIRKDGQTRHLQCFRNKILWGGKLHDEALYEDITDSKLAEDALKASEEKYSTLVEQSTDGILILDKRRILFANQRMSEISGYANGQLIGKNFPELFTAESKIILNEGFKQRQANPTLPTDYKLQIQTLDGRTTPVETKAKRIFYKDSYTVMVIVRDISDRESAEKALQISEENFRNSIENSPLGIRVVNKQGDTLYTNKALLDIYGYRDLEEFNSTPVKNRYTPDSYAAFHIRMEKRQRGEPLPDNYEVSIVRKDGTERQLQVMRKEVLWGGKQESLVLYVDITQRNQMMTILNELNSILQLITNINQLIVKIDDEADLLQQACEQFVANRRYELGWIGLIKEGSYDVVPSAMAGRGTDYLSVLHVSWDDSEYSQGPTGTAIKTGKTSAVKDIAQDPRFLPWRDAALKRDLKSAASLPLIIEDKVIGVVSLYSSAEDAFNEKELYLLGELAGDLSLGIEKIRRRQQHLLMEETLRHERDRARTYLDTAGVMMVVFNTDGKVALINRRGCEILGYASEEIVGKNWFTGFVPERKRAQAISALHSVLAGKLDPVEHYENQVVAKDGQEKTISWNSVELRDEKGQITGILSSGEDITERKKTEEALKASEQNFRNSIDQTFIGWYIVDEQWKALYVNHAFLQMFGYKDIDEVRETPPNKFYTPESQAYFRLRRELERLGEKTPAVFDIDIIRKDGSLRHFQIYRRQVLWSGKLHDQISYNDITERVQAEEALKLSEQNFRNSIDSSPLGIRITDIEDNTIYLNQAFLNIFGYKNIDEVRGDSPVKYYSKDSYADYLQRKAKRLRGEQVPQQVDVDITLRDGSLRHIQIFPREVFWNGKQQFQTIYNDITERKQAEQALRASEQNFRNSMDSSTIGIRIVDAEWHTLYANRVYLDIFGYDNIDEIDSVQPKELYTAKDYQLYLERQQKRARGEYVSDNLDLEILRKDGAVRYVQTSRSEVLWNGQKQYQMLINDVTELQLAEQALKASEQNFHNSLENSFEGINIADDQGHVYYVNKAFLDIFGYKNIDEVRASPPHEHYTPEERARYQRRLETLQRGERNPDEIEIDIIRLDGQTRHLQVFRREVLWDNKKQRMVLFNDITDRVQAEKALRESEEKYRLIVENSRDIIFTINADGNLIYISPSINKVLGYGQNELVGSTLTSIVHPDDVQLVLESIRLNIQQGLNTPGGIEFRARNNSGEWRWQNGIGTAVRDDKGAFISFIGVIRDITEHRQIEKALLESEEKYRLIVENSQDIIFTLNATGEFVYISPSVKTVLGYDQSRLMGRPFMSIVHDEDVHIIRTVSEFNDTVTGEYHSPDIQYRVRHASGELRWLSSKGTIMRDKDRNFINFIGIANDITGRKQAETALQESEEKYRLIVENSQDIIFTLNSTGEFVYVSPAVTDVLGYNPAELIGQSFLTIVMPEDMQLLRDTIQHTRSLQGDYQYPDLEYRARHRSNGFRWLFIKSTVVRDKDGKFLNFLGIANDITERKKIEEALKASEQNFRNSMDTSPTGIRISDMENHTMYANKALMDIFDYSDMHEVETKPPHEFYAPQSYAAYLERNKHLHRGDPMPAEIELDILRKDGSLRHLLVAMKEIMWDRNQRYQTIYRDITEDKKAEEEKHRIEEKAQVASRLAAMGEMAAGIAHEINNPLTGVLGFSQIMIAKENVPEEIKDDLRMIAESSQRVADIVKRLLTFARQAKPVKSFVNLNELIDNTLKLRDYVLKTANIDVVTHLDPALPWSYVDSGQLQQVFLNLIVNAEQAMKETQRKGTLTITTERKDNIIRIVFKDDGPGITRENLVHLFEPFFTTKAPGEGTGLGLSLSRSIILEHDGKMNVESEPGYGAAFIIELPVIEIPPPVSSNFDEIKKPQTPVIRKGKILVVDDEPVVRSTLARVLTKMGHTVDAIADAGKAIEKLDSGIVYDLILSDVRMPGMNGIELYSRILEKAPTMKNRIIFITGDVMGVDIKTFLTRNNLSYLAKPFDIELLKEKTNMMMAEQSGDKPQESAG